LLSVRLIGIEKDNEPFSLYPHQVGGGTQQRILPSGASQARFDCIAIQCDGMGRFRLNYRMSDFIEYFRGGAENGGRERIDALMLPGS
jgi:hypothetical protein